MSLSARVARLRQQSLAAVPTLSSERARLVTEWYATHSELLSVPMERALVFAHLMKNVTVKIWPDELIVGEKGPGPKAAPTYPELCCHSLQISTFWTRVKRRHFTWALPTGRAMQPRSFPSGVDGPCARRFSAR